MSVEPYRIGIVLSPRSWSGRLHSFVADHVPGVELIMVRDDQAAIETAPHVLLADDSTPWLTPSFVSRADSTGIRIVGVYDRTDGGTGKELLAGLGLTHLLEEAMPSDDVVFLLDRLRPAADDVQDSPRPDSDDEGEERRGVVVAVGGPSGSGAREVAVGLSSTWADDGWATLLVDANETTPGIARRLGIGIYPHILTAVDRVQRDGVEGIRASLADRIGPRQFDVLAGMPTTRDWDRLMASDLEALLRTCRDGWDRIVVTTSPLIEDLQRWGDRFGGSRRVLSISDAAVGCCEPTPRGVLRYLDWLVEASGLQPMVLTALNKVPRSARIAAEARQQLREVAGSLIDDVVEVPFDRRVVNAEWDGTEVARGPFRKAIRVLPADLDQQLDAVPTVVAS